MGGTPVTYRVLWCLTAAIQVGCAAHRVSTEPVSAHGQRAGADHVQHTVSRAREGPAPVWPRHAPEAEHLERSDGALEDARALLDVEPTAVHHREMAEAYARSGVRDAAFDHFTAALKLRPRDSRALDGRARVWRDWGFPHLGLADVHRAIFYAPSSPGAYNTLGTMLLKLGLAREARAAFERALAVDSEATYAMNNLCYVDLLQGFPVRAIETCGRTLARQPELAVARNNLALAHAAAGDLESAAREFSHGRGPSAASYNYGIALLATGRYADAALAFDRAESLRPNVGRAIERAAEARRLSRRDAGKGPFSVHR